jgi:hypothetical protein
MFNYHTEVILCYLTEFIRYRLKDKKTENMLLNSITDQLLKTLLKRHLGDNSRKVVMKLLFFLLLFFSSCFILKSVPNIYPDSGRRHSIRYSNVGHSYQMSTVMSSKLITSHLQTT